MTDLAPTLLGLAAVLGALVLVVMAVTGRAKVRSCCAVPVERDLRMRDASRIGEIS